MRLDFLYKLNFYFDPGSGSVILQIIMAGLLSGGVLVRIFWKKIKAFFTRNDQSQLEDADPTEIPDDSEDIQL
jgi:hypothetical protein